MSGSKSSLTIMNINALSAICLNNFPSLLLIFYVLAEQWVEFMVSRLLGRPLNILAILPALFALVIFEIRVQLYAYVALDSDPPYFHFPRSW
jgi:hypothetical protein